MADKSNHLPVCKKCNTPIHANEDRVFLDGKLYHPLCCTSPRAVEQEGKANG